MLENDHCGEYKGISVGSQTSVVANTCSDGTSSIKEETMSTSSAIRNGNNTFSKEE